MTKTINILAVDPSINHLGWAWLRSEIIQESIGQEVVIPYQYGTINAPAANLKLPLEQRLRWMITALHRRLSEIHFAATAVVPEAYNCVVIERPEQWGAYKSIASQHSDSLIMLQLITGALFMWGVSFLGDAYFVRVSDWKGQLPKEITEQRLRQRFPVDPKTDHESDALCIGIYFLEKQILDVQGKHHDRTNPTSDIQA